MQTAWYIEVFLWFLLALCVITVRHASAIFHMIYSGLKHELSSIHNQKKLSIHYYYFSTSLYFVHPHLFSCSASSPAHPNLLGTISLCYIIFLSACTSTVAINKFIC
jgi:hypothetical protein